MENMATEDQVEQNNGLTQNLQKVYNSLNSKQRAAYDLFPTLEMKIFYLEGILTEREKRDLEISSISSKFYVNVAIGIGISALITSLHSEFLLLLSGIVLGIRLINTTISVKREYLSVNFDI